jgi:hypothetical protein
MRGSAGSDPRWRARSTSRVSRSRYSLTYPVIAHAACGERLDDDAKAWDVGEGLDLIARIATVSLGVARIKDSEGR